MIFVSVGSQEPFDRLIKAMDSWCGRSGRKDMFAQISKGEYTPKHMMWERYLDPDQFSERLSAADIVVSHAGMGTVIQCMETGKRLMVMPRQAKLREHRNDHQMEIAKYLSAKPNIRVVFQAAELEGAMRELIGRKNHGRSRSAQSNVSRELLSYINQFVHQA